MGLTILGTRRFLNQFVMKMSTIRDIIKKTNDLTMDLLKQSRNYWLQLNVVWYQMSESDE